MIEGAFKLTVGLEVHAELKTKTKMFCDSRNDPDETRPNVNICPVCLAHPGTLPVINKEAVRQVLRVGLAVGGQIADATRFDRKNYFYPDIPKGYQISQHLQPLVAGGELAGIDLTRIHLEEDTASSVHDQTPDTSLVDFNRAGVPLMELVTEPVIHSPIDAANFAKELQLLLWSLGASDANLEKGEMRIEANVSVSNSNQLGTKVEVKNLNSFRTVERAIAFEAARQQKLIEAGETVVQETRGWDEAKQQTFSQRQKESSHDYRYFPDPDLPPFKVSEIFKLDDLRATLPELPWQKRDRYTKTFGLKAEDAEALVVRPALGQLFETVVAGGDADLIKLAGNYLTNDLVNLLGADDTKLPDLAKPFTELMVMAKAGEISSRGAKDILAVLVNEGGDPRKIAEAKNLFQQSDTGALETIAKQIIEANPNVVADYRAGKPAALQFLIGQGMKASKGSANPAALGAIITKLLS